MTSKMHNKGLTKLMEECGELVQAAAKKSAFMDTDRHPDGTDLRERLEHEIADVRAAVEFVTAKFGLDRDRIGKRTRDKLSRFTNWDSAP